MKFIVPLPASVNAKVMVPTGVNVTGPAHAMVGAGPPEVLYKVPVQPLPDTVQFEAT